MCDRDVLIGNLMVNIKYMYTRITVLCLEYLHRFITIAQRWINDVSKVLT